MFSLRLSLPSARPNWLRQMAAHPQPGFAACFQLLKGSCSSPLWPSACPVNKMINGTVYIRSKREKKNAHIQPLFRFAALQINTELNYSDFIKTGMELLIILQAHISHILFIFPVWTIQIMRTCLLPCKCGPVGAHAGAHTHTQWPDLLWGGMQSYKCVVFFIAPGLLVLHYIIECLFVSQSLKKLTQPVFSI